MKLTGRLAAPASPAYHPTVRWRRGQSAGPQLIRDPLGSDCQQ
jgi:hypothetical protein